MAWLVICAIILLRSSYTDIPDPTVWRKPQKEFADRLKDEKVLNESNLEIIACQQEEVWKELDKSVRSRDRPY